MVLGFWKSRGRRGRVIAEALDDSLDELLKKLAGAVEKLVCCFFSLTTVLLLRVFHFFFPNNFDGVVVVLLLVCGFAGFEGLFYFLFLIFFSLVGVN